MVTMKGLPLAYSKDMQDDKPPVFEAHDLLDAVARGDGRDGRDGRVRARADARGGRARASRPRPTSPTGWCARPDVPFREAHHITGRAVKLAEERGCGLAELSLDDLQAIDERIDERVYGVLSVDASVAAGPATAAPRPSGSASRLRRRRKHSTRHPGPDPGLPAFAPMKEKAIPAQGRDDG